MIINGLSIADSIVGRQPIFNGHKKLCLLYEGNERNQQSYMKRIKKDFESKNIIVDLWEVAGTDTMSHQTQTTEKIKAINILYDKILAVKPFTNSTQFVLEEYLDKNKDIDNILNLKKGYSCTSEAVQEILKFCKVDIQNSKIVVVGSRGEGDDIIRILSNYTNNGTVVGIHSKTPEHLKRSLLSQAEVVILATGKQNIYSMDDLKRNTSAEELFIIDVGRGEATQGVVDYCSNSPNTHITTALNGVGAVTTACLLRRILVTKY